MQTNRHRKNAKENIEVCGDADMKTNSYETKVQKKKIIRSAEVRKKYSKAKIGEKNPMWVGDKVSYKALHDYIRVNKPKPLFCEKCGKQRKLELANKEGKNYTRNPNDYEYDCRSCHTALDIRLGIKKRDKITGRYVKCL